MEGAGAAAQRCPSTQHGCPHQLPTDTHQVTTTMLSRATRCTSSLQGTGQISRARDCCGTQLPLCTWRLWRLQCCRAHQRLMKAEWSLRSLCEGVRASSGCAAAWARLLLQLLLLLCLLLRGLLLLWLLSKILRRAALHPGLVCCAGWLLGSCHRRLNCSTLSLSRPTCCSCASCDSSSPEHNFRQHCTVVWDSQQLNATTVLAAAPPGESLPLSSRSCSDTIGRTRA